MDDRLIFTNTTCRNLQCTVVIGYYCFRNLCFCYLLFSILVCCPIHLKFMLCAFGVNLSIPFAHVLGRH
uniref:Uncharacterized protein n=1 Tax=Zea mays TaxID=4577 RepID=C0HJ17_MAIZE|nr:unknown [Zea mays]